MKSIQQKSMVLLSSLALLVMAIIFSVSYALVASYFDSALAKQMDDTDNTLSIVLKEPIFSYDAALTNNILSSFIAAPYVHEIKAFDHRDKLIGEAQAGNTAVASDELRMRQLDIIWDGKQKIGHLEVTYRLDSNDELLAATRLMLLLMAISLLLALLAANWLVLRRYVVAPVKQVAHAMAEIVQGGGDLTRRLAITSRDEIGELAGNFNRFVSNLQSLMQRIVGSAEQLTQCADEIKDNASHNTTAVHRQQQEIELVATSLNQMSSTTQEVSANANLTAEKTQRCSESASSGSRIVSETVRKINVLGEDIDTTSEKITELKDKSNHITTVLDVIKGIAEQTNLLALNAAIEAARAGEQGRGFAVVADEVRALAQRTQASTEEIDGIIRGLQSSSEEASQFMIATRTSLGTTISESRQASSALEDIIANIGIINDMNAQVAASTEEQNSVARDVSEKVVSINNITELVTGNAHKVTTLSAQLDNVSASIKQDLANFKL